MHELGIAVSIVEGACEELSKLGLMRVQAVRLRLGALSGVAKDALLFSFEAAAAGTPIEGARLDIEDVPAAVWCGRCRAERTLAQISHRRCPSCDAVTPEILRGEDLEIVGLEVADA